MKVKFEDAEFIVSPVDKLYIEIRKIILFIKRQKRRFHILFPSKDLLLYGLITVMWCVFGAISYFWGQTRYLSAETPYRLIDVMWELKSSYFTSVVISLFVCVYNRGQTYSRLIRNQHYIYTDALYCFDRIFKEFLGDEICYYMPLYCEKTLNDTENYILRLYSKDFTYYSDLFESTLRKCYQKISDLEVEVKKGNVFDVDEEFFLMYADDAKEIILTTIENRFISQQNLFRLSFRFMLLLDYLRKPWRYDTDAKIKILTILSHYPRNEIPEQFYYNMLLNGHNMIKSDYDESMCTA